MESAMIEYADDQKYFVIIKNSESPAASYNINVTVIDNQTHDINPTAMNQLPGQTLLEILYPLRTDCKFRSSEFNMEIIDRSISVSPGIIIFSINSPLPIDKLAEIIFKYIAEYLWPNRDPTEVIRRIAQ